MIKKVQAHWRKLADEVHRRLPEHQIYLRANGEVRFFTVSTRVQVMGLSAAAIALMWVGVSTWSFVGEGARLAAKDRQLAELHNRFEALTQDMSVLEQRVLGQARTLEERQNRIRSVLTDWLNEAELKFEIKPAQFLDGAITPLIDANSEAWLKLPEGALSDVYLDRYAAIQNRQDSLVTHLREAARVEYDKVEEILAGMNLSTGDLVGGGALGLGGTGGPLLEDENAAGLATTEDTLEDLLGDWEYLKAIRNVVRSIPAMVPVDQYFISSNYGRRLDPITKRSAFHPGLDLGVWYGSKVMAPTEGTVSYAGYKAGYGKMVEIDHGNGFKTRFGHLRKVLTKRGKQVAMGDVVAESGNTGRSTGPHLHYEVWFQGKPVDPKPYLEASQHVLEIQRRPRNG